MRCGYENMSASGLSSTDTVYTEDLFNGSFRHERSVHGHGNGGGGCDGAAGTGDGDGIGAQRRAWIGRWGRGSRVLPAATDCCADQGYNQQ